MILVILFLFVSRVMPVSQKVQKELGALNTILQENLAGMHVVKAFATENFELEQYRRKNENLLDINLDLVAIFSKYFPLIGLYLLGNFNDA